MVVIEGKDSDNRRQNVEDTVNCWKMAKWNMGIEWENSCKEIRDL